MVLAWRVQGGPRKWYDNTCNGLPPSIGAYNGLDDCQRPGYVGYLVMSCEIIAVPSDLQLQLPLLARAQGSVAGPQAAHHHSKHLPRAVTEDKYP
jgi:hypothetical protein